MKKKKLTTDDLIELATPIPGLPRKFYSPTGVKKDLKRILERLSKTKEPFTIIQNGVLLAVVVDWRDFVALEQRRTRLTTIMNAVEFRPRFGKIPGLVRGDAFQKLLGAYKRVQSMKEQIVILKAGLFDEQQKLTMGESELASLERQFRESATK